MASRAKGAELERRLARRFMPGRTRQAEPPPVAADWLARRLLNPLLRPLGLEIRHRRDLEIADVADDHAYYWYNAIKKIDIRTIEGFGRAAEEILTEGRTYLNYDRLYTLWQGVSSLPSAAVAVAEVGAYQGGSAKLIAEALAWRGLANRVYVCDTFEGHTVVDPALDGAHRVGKQFRNTSVRKVVRYLRHYANVQVVAGDFLVTSDQLPPDERYGLVHVDVDVYPVTRHCLQYFGSRLVDGGLMVVDDYGFLTCQGVRHAVDEFMAAQPSYRLVHLLTGQALVVRIGGSA